MLVHAITEVALHAAAIAGSLHAEGVGNVCAAPPAGVEPYVKDILGWVKYGVIAIIIGTGFASIGAMIIGKMGSMGRAAQVGASGLFWSVLGAVAFVVIYGVLNGIVGNGC
jgi:hypothetical protein